MSSPSSHSRALVFVNAGNSQPRRKQPLRRKAKWQAVLLLIGALTVSAQADLLYWDANGGAAGAGSAPAGTWGSSAFWSIDPTGGSESGFRTDTTSADDLHFVAGPSATSGSSAYTVTIDGTQAANRLVFQSTGIATLEGGIIELGAGGINARQYAYGTTARARVNISSQISLQTSVVIANDNVTTANGIWITGAISQAGSNYSITKEGTGALNLAGANTFSGGVILNSGILSLRNASALGTGTLQVNGGTITVSNEITIANNSQIWAGDFSVGTYSGTQNIGAGSVLLTGNRSVSIADFQTFIVGGVIGDDGEDYSLTKTGAGTLRLNGANTFSGGVELNNGGLVIGHAKALGTGTLTINGGRIITNGTTLDGNAQIWSGDFSVTAGTGAQNMGTGAVTLKGASRSVTIDSGRTLTVGGSISGEESSFGLNKLGAGSLNLTGHNSYTGDTTISAGTLTLTENGNLTLLIGTDGVNTRITNTAGTLNLNGSFTFDLSGAASTVGANWNIVTGAATYGTSFSVIGFDYLGDNLWALDQGGATYQFDQTSGQLSITAIPEPSSLLLGGGAALLLLYAFRSKKRLAA